MRDHRKLRAFELTDELVTAVYAATRQFPRDELFGITSQMRRAAVSTVANIVEGSARQSSREYVRFLQIAMGSLRELGYYLELSERLGYLKLDAAEALRAQHDHAARILGRLVQSMEEKLRA